LESASKTKVSERRRSSIAPRPCPIGYVRLDVFPSIIHATISPSVGVGRRYAAWAFDAEPPLHAIDHDLAELTSRCGSKGVAATSMMTAFLHIDQIIGGPAEEGCLPPQPSAVNLGSESGFLSAARVMIQAKQDIPRTGRLGSSPPVPPPVQSWSSPLVCCSCRVRVRADDARVRVVVSSSADQTRVHACLHKPSSRTLGARISAIRKRPAYSWRRSDDRARSFFQTGPTEPTVGQVF